MPKQVTPQRQSIDVHIGAVIKERRIAQGMSQVDLGKALDLTGAQIGKYETGQAGLTTSRLAEMALALNTPLSTFFAGLPMLGPLAA